MMCSGLLTSSDKLSPKTTHMDMNIQCHVYVHAHRITYYSEVEKCVSRSTG